MSDTESAITGAAFITMMFYPLVGLGVAVCLDTLMPLAYKDLSLSPLKVEQYDITPFTYEDEESEADQDDL